MTSEIVEPVHDSQQCILPSFKDGFSEVIAAADRESVHSTQCTSGRASPQSEYSWAATSPSTAQWSPATSPTTPHYNISPQSQLDIQMRYTPYQDESERKKRHLALNHLRRASSQSELRRASSHSALRGGFDAYSSRLAPGSKQLRRPASTANLKVCKKKERHFNQKYQNPDKLFIVYCKDDLKKGWAEIQALRLKMLPLLLGNDYDPTVEENRQVSGLNGMYYRENDLNMPVLTPDGSGLEFVEKDGRWWECMRSQKCRTGDDRTTKKPSAADASRCRGMVERYPEEVLEYWDKHVQHFVPKENREEVLARAIRYCKSTSAFTTCVLPHCVFEANSHLCAGRIRADQRKDYGIPQWTLDNREDRVLDITLRKADENPTTANTKTSRRTKM